MKFRSLRLAALGTLGIASVTAFAEPPKPMPTLTNPADADYGTRPVAYIYGNVAVTRAELAEFLIARGGYEKVELLVNKKIIDAEAAKRGITVTTIEMEAELERDLKGIAVDKDKFIEVVLSKYGKTYYEWMEDVVRPRIMLTKMCQSEIVITEDDLRAEFERQHGEKRKVQIIIWPKNDDLKAITKVWTDIRKDAKEFDRIALQQANPGLASTAGHGSPIGRNLLAEEKVIEEKAFAMKPGDVTEIFMTSQGYMVMKCHDIIAADAKVTFEQIKPTLEKNVRELLLSKMIPTYFKKLKEGAKPDMLMAGPPEMWNFKKSTKDMASEAVTPGGIVPAKGEQKK